MRDEIITLSTILLTACASPTSTEVLLPVAVHCVDTMPSRPAPTFGMRAGQQRPQTPLAEAAAVKALADDAAVLERYANQLEALLAGCRG